MQLKHLISALALTQLYCNICVAIGDVPFGVRRTKYKHSGGACSDTDCGRRSQAATSATGKLDCARQCTNTGDCLGFSVEEDDKCYLYEDCSWQRDCLGVAWQPAYTFYLKVGIMEEICQNGGIWKDEENGCRCINGWAGKFCHRPVHACSDLPRYEDGYKYGKQMVDVTLPVSGRVVAMYCETSPRHASTLVLRHDGSPSFDLLWEEYVRGRYNSLQSYWIGLDTLHELTELGYNRLSFEVIYKGFPGYTTHLDRISGFHVGDASTDYTLTLSQSEPVQGGPFTDQYGDVLESCLGPVNGTKFSAPDNDNDLDPDNCAAIVKRGWWFKDCNFLCNPLGDLGGTGDDKLLLAGLDFVDSAYVDRFSRVDMYFYERL